MTLFLLERKKAAEIKLTLARGKKRHNKSGKKRTWGRDRSSGLSRRDQSGVGATLKLRGRSLRCHMLHIIT
jgi:hypothetical protein